MKAVTLTAPSYNELKSLFLVRKLYIPSDVILTPTQFNELCKRFVKGYEKLKEIEDVKKVMLDVNKYTEDLENLGITDRNVKSEDFTYSWVIKKNLISCLLTIVFLLVCLPALIILLPFAYVVNNKAERERIAVKLIIKIK